jgi:hypothetical protein
MGLEGREAYGQHGCSWQENRAHVTHRLSVHAGHELDILERLQITEDEKFLLYERELYAGGRVVKQKEEFPIV